MRYIHTSEIHNTRSSDIILPILFELIQPNSILDVGCGIGTWLKSSSDLGISDIIGIDGEYVNKEQLLIQESQFLGKDLNHKFYLKRNFDLLLCLEVAEHLSEFVSDMFIDSLVRHSDVILFSAAIPGQGGQNHLNEQWPDYWAKKFSVHEFVFLDIIRPLIWDNQKVDYWYRQNIFLVVKHSHELVTKYPNSHLSFIHPELYLAKNAHYQRKIRSLKNQLDIHPLKRWIKNLISKK
ncbi:class I SAM-dependent methyltransferase [Algoriphagus sp. PAP.12]|uniref:class I SAM-dependent methyltransferase n=1 Tax=Algoriphagus sp. PAP.12 TaxID=2996678 RepID=UPI00227B7E75|nr:class I SAM-dependent methyltransferase [Algoriphagus sp. PAP.12]